MEAKVNLVLLVALLAAWAGLTMAEPAAALDPQAHPTDELAALEDSYALHRDNPLLAEELADRYLALGRPQLAIAALSASTPSVRENPAVLHRLAQAYEETGRMHDALGTANLARARCARALGTWDSSLDTPVPTHRCSEGTLAALDVHVNALSNIVRWGVTDVSTDPLAERAYRVAMRSARILSASTR